MGSDGVMSKVRSADLLRISLRLAFLQTTWCEQGMQSVGLAYCLLPGLKRIYATQEEMNEAIKDHQEPFNTHPFLVAVLVGVTLKLKEDGKDSREINSFLRSTMGPLAALGDPFFRGALPFFVAVMSSLAAMVGGLLAGILTLLVLFNAMHIFVRFSGIVLGYRESYAVLKRVAYWLSPARTIALKTVSAVGAGVVLIIGGVKYGPSMSAWYILPVAVLGIGAAACFMKWKIVQVYALPLALALSLFAKVLI